MPVTRRQPVRFPDILRWGSMIEPVTILPPPPPESPGAEWDAVRCVFRTQGKKPWGPTDLKPGTSSYEERVTLWRATSAGAAIELAEAEALEYTEHLGAST